MKTTDIYIFLLTNEFSNWNICSAVWLLKPLWLKNHGEKFLSRSAHFGGWCFEDLGSFLCGLFLVCCFNKKISCSVYYICLLSWYRTGSKIDLKCKLFEKREYKWMCPVCEYALLLYFIYWCLDSVLNRGSFCKVFIWDSESETLKKKSIYLNSSLVCWC